MRFMGGQIVAYPLLYALHQHMPHARLRVVARDPVGRDYTDLPWPVEFVQVDGWLDHYRTLGRRTDIMMALHYTSERYGMLAALARPRLRLGFANKRFTDRIWTHRWNKNFNEYLAVANVQLLRQVFDIDIEQNSRACFQALADSADQAITPSDVVFMPGGGAGAYKRWGLNNFLHLHRSLVTRLGNDLSFTVVMGPDEREEYERLRVLALPNVHLMMTRPIAEIAAVCMTAKLIVANDCGPSHVGQGACVPYVGVFHCPNPSWYWDRPYSRCVIPEGEGLGDIQRVTPDQVLRACEAVWETGPAHRAVASQPESRPARQQGDWIDEQAPPHSFHSAALPN